MKKVVGSRQAGRKAGRKMIVKFQVNLVHQCGWESGWEVISDITSYRYFPITKEEGRNRKGLNDYIQALDESGKVDEKVKIYKYVQAWHKRNSEPINIVTNMVIYVLNDEGKTIERIN